MTRVVIVTGAAGGVGAATCDLLEEEGWDVVPVDRIPCARANALQVDIADLDSLVPALKRVPRVDALVNNAAMQHFKPLSDTSFAEWDTVHEVNVRGGFACLQATMPQLINARGAVVNVSSVHAFATSRSIAAYAASKGAMLAFTRAAALELAPHGVRVNAVVPGALDTPALHDGLHRSGDPDGARRRLIEATPLGRIGSPSDVAHAISFLLDARRAAFMTGQSIAVDGGVLSRLASE